MEYNTITLYKFIKIENPQKLVKELRTLCENLNLKGRILMGEEGINAGVCGKNEDVEEFKSSIKAMNEFDDVTFRELSTEDQTYHRLVVRIRDEIITLGSKVDMSKKADYITPENLKKLYDKEEEFIILDTRNKYEADVGRFKNAITLPIDTFHHFSEAINKLEYIKDKKIITYCTGGIRCEKASAYMKSQGFENVLQLKGGIINYVQTFPGQEFEGDLFVFDDRLVTSTGSEKKLGLCKICKTPCNSYTDCYNMECDDLFICCDECKIKMNNTCSEECKNSPRHRSLKVSLVVS